MQMLYSQEIGKDCKWNVRSGSFMQKNTEHKCWATLLVKKTLKDVKSIAMEDCDGRLRWKITMEDCDGRNR